MISINNLIVRSSRARLIKTRDWSVNQFGQLSKRPFRKSTHLVPQKLRRASGFRVRGLRGKQPAAVVAGSGRQRASFWSGSLSTWAHARFGYIWRPPPPPFPSLPPSLSPRMYTGPQHSAGVAAGRWRCALPWEELPGSTKLTGTTFPVKGSQE